MKKMETISKATEDLEKEDLARQNEVFMLSYFTRKGFVFKKEDLNKPVTLRKVLEMLLTMEVER
jgi:hypothetical protein